MRHLLKTDVEIWAEIDPTGEWGDTGSESLVDEVKGRLVPESSREIFRNGKPVGIVTHTLFLVGTTITERNFVKIDGVRYEVIAPPLEYSKHTEVPLEKAA